MTFWSSQGTLPHPLLRMSYIYPSPFLSLKLMCMWGLWLAHVCGVPVRIILNLIFSCQSASYWFDYLVIQKELEERKGNFFPSHMACPLWITIWQVHIKLNIHLPCNLAILLLGICPGEMKYISTQRLNMNVNNKTIHNEQKSETRIYQQVNVNN